MPIVHATGAASGPNVSAQAVEDAMTEAILQCAREGITDPVVIRERMLAARDAVTEGRP